MLHFLEPFFGMKISTIFRKVFSDFRESCACEIAKTR